jgi:hypothetical protein
MKPTLLFRQAVPERYRDCLCVASLKHFSSWTKLLKQSLSNKSWSTSLLKQRPQIDGACPAWMQRHTFWPFVCAYFCVCMWLTTYARSVQRIASGTHHIKHTTRLLIIVLCLCSRTAGADVCHVCAPHGFSTLLFLEHSRWTFVLDTCSRTTGADVCHICAPHGFSTPFSLNIVDEHTSLIRAHAQQVQTCATSVHHMT